MPDRLALLPAVGLIGLAVRPPVEFVIAFAVCERESSVSFSVGVLFNKIFLEDNAGFFWTFGKKTQGKKNSNIQKLKQKLKLKPNDLQMCFTNQEFVDQICSK